MKPDPKDEKYLKEELEAALRLQKSLQADLKRLDERLQSLQRRLDEPAAVPVLEAEKPPVPLPPPLPPGYAELSRDKEKQELSEDAQPKVLEKMPQEPESAPVPPAGAEAKQQPQAPPETPRVPEVKKDSFELRFGMVWLVRIGIFIFLTGLVLAGGYTYENYIVHWGPLPKVFAMYLVSGGLAALGLWLERSRESLKNYARVLLGGGLAAVYYTTYASHYVEPLKWIDSTAVTALLLLAWGGFMVWLAELKKSQVMASIGLLLAYYTCIINPISWFTLFSNLILGGVGVTLMVRNRWSLCSWLSLPATYGAFAWWQFWDKTGSTWDWPVGQGDFTLGVVFLTSYWLLFAAGMFLVRVQGKSAESRAGFLCLNNMAYYALVTISFPAEWREHIWFWTLAYGTFLVLCGVASHVKGRQPGVISHGFLVMGLIWMTSALFIKFSGYQLALLVLMESVILLLAARPPFRTALRSLSAISAFLAVLLGVDHMLDREPGHLALALLMGGLLLFQAFWDRYAARETKDQSEDEGIRGLACMFTLLSTLCWLCAGVVQMPESWRAPVLAFAALGLSLIAVRFRFPELRLFSSFYLWAGYLVWFSLDESLRNPWWNPLLLVMAGLGLSALWQHWGRRAGSDLRMFTEVGVFVSAVLGTAVLAIWINEKWDVSDWMLCGGGLAFLSLLYGLVMRNWAMALTGQSFLVIAVASFFRLVVPLDTSWYLALVPMASVLAMGLALKRLSELNRQGGPVFSSQVLIPATWVYRLLGMFMLLFWLSCYIPDTYMPTVLGLVGVACAVWGMRPFDGLRYAYGSLLILIGVAFFMVDGIRWALTRWNDLIFLIALLVWQQSGRRWSQEGSFCRMSWWNGLQSVLLVMMTWIFMGRWVDQVFGGFFLTVSWSLLAMLVFVAGLLLRERTYRLAGLAILVCTIGRIIFVDLWQFGTLSRIISLLVSGAVLGILGYIYNRYSETLKKYL